MNKGMKKRWISLYVENQVGVLSKISGLFSAKSYNLDSLTVGTTEDPTSSSLMLVWIPSNCWRRMEETSLTFICSVILLLFYLFSSSPVRISRSCVA